MPRVTSPREMNETFARLYNSRNLEDLVSLYEPGAVHVDPTGKTTVGSAIRAELESLLRLRGTMVSTNSFCLENGDLALLRADWTVTDERGAVVASGSSTEVVRRQADGRWLYVIDHAGGASLPPSSPLRAAAAPCESTPEAPRSPRNPCAQADRRDRSGSLPSEAPGRTAE